MAPTSLPPVSDSQQLVHALGNICAALEAGLQLLEEVKGDAAREQEILAAMARQVQTLKDLIRPGAEMPTAPARTDASIP